MRRTSAEWIELLNEAGVPCGPIYAVDGTFRDPQVTHLGIAHPLDHPVLGPIALVGQAIHLTRTPQSARGVQPAPELGADTERILGDLGYDSQAIEGLRARGVI